MDHYIDIKLLPDAEIDANFLLNKVYSKLHKALFGLQSRGIGISFPEYNDSLGKTLRLHGSIQELETLQALHWTGRLTDYCAISGIQRLPDNLEGYRTVARRQPKMSMAKLRRLLQRGSITEAEIKQYQAKLSDQKLPAPYVELQSASNGHKHRRYIVMGELQQTAVAGAFDTFGLSSKATIPWF